MDYYATSLELHREHHGKISVEGKVPLECAQDLSVAYTPGVAEPCRRIAADPASVYDYTVKGSTIAVVSDGSAVLGLGNIGAAAAIPVMEGKSILFKKFGGVDAFPICLDTQDADEIVESVRRLAPVFGGINLEDIASPKCFAIEARLEEELDIPVFHDDQHGTAIVVTAALINALKVVGKELPDVRVVQNGPGAAGTAIIKMMRAVGVRDVIAVDTKGIIHAQRADVVANPDGHKAQLAQITNASGLEGGLADALEGADVFIGTSAAGVLSAEMVRSMAPGAVVFAMANPTPEIMPDEALAAGAAVVGTGRSDFANQINNVLAFPGVFRGALDVRARNITYDMKIAAAYAIAGLVESERLAADYIVPSALDPRVAPAVAAAVAQAALDTGVPLVG